MSLDLAPPAPRPGQVYLNTKRGSRYQVVLIATHSETEEEMVVYRDVVTQRNFTRPVASFVGFRGGESGLMPRFVLEADRGEA